MRIVQKDLEKLVSRINQIKGHGENPAYNRPGSFHLDFAYGGVKLVRVSNGGGETEISTLGYSSKKDLWIFLRGILSGYQIFFEGD